MRTEIKICYCSAILAMALILFASMARAQFNTVQTVNGGTGQNWSSASTGSLPYFSAPGVLSLLAPGTNGFYLEMVGGVPTWAVAPEGYTFVLPLVNTSGVVSVGNATASRVGVASFPTSGGLVVSSGVVSESQPITSIGSGLSLAGGVLSATGGGGTGSAEIPINLGSTYFAQGYQIAPGSGGYELSPLLCDGLSGDTATGYPGGSIIVNDTFNRANTFSGAAGNTTSVGNGWTDVAGNIYSINSGALHVVFDSLNSSQYQRDWLLRPSLENELNAEEILTFPAPLGASGTNLGPFLRWQSGVTNGTFYWAFEHSAGSSSQLYIVKLVAGTLTTLVTSSTYTETNGHVYKIDFVATGATPTTLDATLTDTTSSTVIATLSTTDSTAGLQTSGSYGMVGNGGSTGFGVNSAETINLSGASGCVLFDAGQRGIVKVTSVEMTAGWDSNLTQVLEHSSDGVTWTSQTITGTPTSNGGTFATQSFMTSISPITDRFWRWSATDSGNNLVLYDFRLN